MKEKEVNLVEELNRHRVEVNKLGIDCTPVSGRPCPHFMLGWTSNEFKLSWRYYDLYILSGL
jgi:hypothetical protein